jgi:hypothetical protein
VHWQKRAVAEDFCAAFVLVAALVMAVGLLDQRRGRRDRLDLLAQGRLVVLDLDDQGDVALCGDLEIFYWPGNASSVTMVPLARPSSASSLCAAGTSVDFSAMSRWASTTKVSVANFPPVLLSTP